MFECAVKHDCVFGVPDLRISEIELVSKVPSLLTPCRYFCDPVVTHNKRAHLSQDIEKCFQVL